MRKRGQDRHAEREEGGVVPDVAVLGVADLVAEDRVQFVRRHLFENAVGEDHVADARQEADDHGVRRCAVRGPQQEVGAAEMQPLGHRFEPVADRPGRHRLQAEDRLDQERHEQDQHRDRSPPT